MYEELLLSQFKVDVELMKFHAAIFAQKTLSEIKLNKWKAEYANKIAEYNLKIAKGTENKPLDTKEE